MAQLRAGLAEGKTGPSALTTGTAAEATAAKLPAATAGLAVGAKPPSAGGPVRTISFTKPTAATRVGISAGDVGSAGPAGAVRVDGLLDGGPAHSAGLRVGDVIRSLNGQPCSSHGEFSAAMRAVSGTVSLEVLSR